MILINNLYTCESSNPLDYYTELLSEGFFSKVGSFLKKILNWISKMLNTVIAHISVGIKNLMYHLRLIDYKSVVIYYFNDNTDDFNKILTSLSDYKIIEVLEQIIQNGDDTKELQDIIAKCKKATETIKNYNDNAKAFDYDSRRRKVGGEKNRC